MLSPMLLPSPGRTLREAASDVATTLRETRRVARAQQMRTQFVLDTESGQYGLRPSGQTRNLPAGLSAQLTTAESLLVGESAGAIEFFPDGSSTGGRVVLGLDNQTVQVDIEWLTGRIRVGSEGG
jgi:general secretion pathway protein H